MQDERAIGAMHVTVALTQAQERWLDSSARRAVPRLSLSERLGQILDDAMAASETDEDARAHQFQIYEASGYPEHHPDYPDTGDNP